MARSKTIYFQDAVRWLGCTPQWLTQQIAKGFVRFTLESDGKGANRYKLSRDDIESLFNHVPKYKLQPAKHVTVVLTTQRKARVSAEIVAEAHELGMGVKEYMREMGMDLE